MVILSSFLDRSTAYLYLPSYQKGERENGYFMQKSFVYQSASYWISGVRDLYPRSNGRIYKRLV